METLPPIFTGSLTRKAGPADEGEPGEQAGLAQFTEDVVMQQFLFDLPSTETIAKVA